MASCHRAMVERERAATLEPTKRRRGLTHNSRAGISKRTFPNCHSKEVNSNQRGCSKNPGVAAPLVSASCRGNFWYQSHSDHNKSSRYSDWTKTNHQGKQLSYLSQKGEKSYVSIRVQKKDKRLKSENTKSDTLGSNPKTARVRARSQFQKQKHGDLGRKAG